jgi:cytochrome c-type biogenesis protein CcmH
MLRAHTETPLFMRIFKHFSLRTPAKWRASFVGLMAVIVVLWLGSSNFTPAHAQVEAAPLPLPSPELAIRLKKLESELRCLVCQNQTLAESPAGLANDLRREVRLLIDQGKSDEEIKTFLQARYGDFVLYRPPVKSHTYLLWFGPFILLGIGAAVAFVVARRRRLVVASPAAPTAASSHSNPQDASHSASHARARALLDGEPDVDGATEQSEAEQKSDEPHASENKKNHQAGKQKGKHKK